MPTVELFAIQDAYFENYNNGFTNNQYLFVGNRPNSAVGRNKKNTLLLFDLSSIGNAHIESATIELGFSHYTASGSNYYLDMIINRSLEYWEEGEEGYRIEEGPSFQYENDSITKMTTEGLSTDYYQFDATNALQAILQSGFNYGFVVTAYDYNSDGAEIRFDSQTDPFNPPKITITYNAAPSNPDLVSPNGGESWTGVQTIEVSPSTDLEGESIQYEYQLSLDNGENWSTIQSLTSATSFTYDFSNEQQTSLALVRARAYDGLSYSDWSQSDGVFTIQHNLPPTPPSNLSPSGKAIDRSIVQRLSWTYNDPDSNDTQSKAVIEWRVQGNATWNVINNNSNRTYFDVSSNVFPVGQIEWRVKTYDQTGAESPFSQIAVFTSADPTDAPTITSPSSTVNVSSPVVQWTVPEQTAYQVVIEDTIGTVIWDTGEVVSTNKAKTIGTALVNGGQYVIKVRVKNNASLWTEYALLNITVSYTPPPKPIINVSSATGHIVIEVENPAPSGTQPTVTGNDVYKRINGEWVKVAAGVNFVPYRDYEVASGVEYNYKVRAIGDNSTFSESNVDFTSTTFRGVWLHTINNAEVTVYNFKFDGGGRESSWEVESSLMRFKGRTRPVIETGEMKDDLIDFNLTLKDDADKEALERIVKSQKIVCYRDGRGRMRFGVFTRMPLSDEIWGGYSTSLQLLYIDYSEGI
jgi:hypothetical protein